MMEKHIKQHVRRGLPGGPNELNKFTEAFIVSSNGQYDYPGQNTLIPNADGRITMKDVDYPVYGIDDEGNSQMMYPEEEYQFPGNSVYEIPMKKGGLVRMPKVEFTKKGKLKSAKKFSRSLQATNRLFTENSLFKKPKSRKRKVFDPNANYAEGGSLPKAEYGMPMGTGMSQNYQGREKFIHAEGGALLTKKVTCKKCGWKWDAADGGDDITTCHKCGGQGLVHAQGGGDISIPTLSQMKDGGFIEAELTADEIEEHRRGGWIVEIM
jgi:hypothetical protein